MNCCSSCRVCFLLWTFSFIGYAVGVLTDYWVTEDNYTWGFWFKMGANQTDEHDTNKSWVHLVSFQDSPGYFKGVFVLAIVTTAAKVIFLLTSFCYDNNRAPFVVSGILHYAGVPTTLILLAANYKTDDRWKDRNPRLGWSFWLVCGYGCLSFAAVLVIVITHPPFRPVPRPPSPDSQRCPLWCCGPDPALPSVTRRPSNASSLSIATGKRITIFHSHTSNLSSIDTGRSNFFLRDVQPLQHRHWAK